MAERTEIAWCDSTFNPWEGCQKVSPGCDHCYAEARNARFGGGTATNWGPGAPRRRTGKDTWGKPEKWNEAPFYECQDCGLRGDAKAMGDEPKTCQHLNARPARRRVFCASLADVFDNAAPSAWRQDLMSLIVRTPHLDWLLLTKRIGNTRRMLSDASMHDGLLLTANDEYRPPANLWIGATIVNREELLRDAAKLKATPAAVRFWSVEPLLEDLGDVPRELMPDWVIVGGESGPGARPMSPDWARKLRDQCAAAGVPFLFKQWGEWAPYGRGRIDGAMLADPTALDTPLQKFGKKLAGRLLDGRTHDEFPAV